MVLLHVHQSLWYTLKIANDKWLQSLLWVKFLWDVKKKTCCFYHYIIYPISQYKIYWLNIKHVCPFTTCITGTWRGCTEHWIPWKLSHRWLGAILWVWTINLKSSSTVILLTLSHLSSQRNTCLTRAKPVFVPGKISIVPTTFPLPPTHRWNEDTALKSEAISNINAESHSPWQSQWGQDLNNLKNTLIYTICNMRWTKTITIDMLKGDLESLWVFHPV